MDDELGERRRRGLYRSRRPVRSRDGVRVHIGGREYLDFSSNDYLNLATDPRLSRAAARAARRFGTGAAASPLVSGWLTPHRRLEAELAGWKSAGAALTFASGFAANLAVLSSVAGRGSAVFSDELNHASLIDGCRLGRGRVHVYRHCDLGHLESLLARHGRTSRRRVIVTDTVFSMDGDSCPLADLIRLAERSDSLLVIDEAHATGVLGDTGAGLAETLAPSDRGDPDRLLAVGTLSKALGCQGGFVTGTARAIDWLANVARPYVFSTGVAPPVCAAAREAVRVARAAVAERADLLRVGELLRNRLADLHYAMPRAGSPIVPVIIGDPHRAVKISAALRREGVLVPAIRPPTVPEGTARLRISLSAGHAEADIRTLTEALSRVTQSDHI